jgi:hypothetical protein
MTHLGTQNIGYGRKKGWKSNCQFDSQPLKVKNHPNFLACRWHATYHWKILNKEYNFSWDFTSIKGLHTKLWAFKITGVPILKILKILRLPSGSHGTKWHLSVGPVAKHRKYYKQESGGFPQVRVVVSMCLPVGHMCTKSDLIMH